MGTILSVVAYFTLVFWGKTNRFVPLKSKLNRMKVLSTVLAFLTISLFAVAQTSNYTASQEGWLVDMNEAHKISQETGKPILANFTGSDWCGWCKRLKAAVFDKPEFKEWADQNVVLLELDFPRKKQIPQNIRQQNYSLQQALGVRGYPTIWVFTTSVNEDTGGMNITKLGKTGYAGSVEAFTGAVDQMLTRAQN